MNEQIENRLTNTLNEYASKVNPDLKQAQYLVRQNLLTSAHSWDEIDRHQQELKSSNDGFKFGLVNKAGKAQLPSSRKTPAQGKLQPLAVLSLSVAVILILSFLIISVVQPNSKDLPVSTSQTKAASQLNPSPSSASVKATVASNIYLGPDNTFHIGSGSTQVSAEPSEPVQTASREANFQILWLVTDSNTTKLAIQISGDKLSFNANNNGVSTDGRGVGMLKDELGQAYPVKVSSSIPIPVNNRNLNGATWWAYAASLPSTVKKLSFIPDSSLPFTLNGSPQINLVKIKEASLPQPTVFDPGKYTTKDKNINLTVPYVYFGSDRTILVVRIYPEPNRPANPSGAGWKTPSYSFPGEVGITVVDSQGQEVLPLTNMPFQPPSSSFLGDNSTPAGAQEQTLVLQPLAAGTKNVQIKVSNIEVSTYRQTDDKGKFLQWESSAAIPLKSLFATGKPQTGPKFEVAGFKVEVTHMEATLDQSVGPLVSLQLNYKIEGPRADDGATPIGISFVYYYADNPVTLNAGGFSGSPGGVQTSYIKFFYEADKSEVQLIAAGVAYSLSGNWQINLPTTSN